MTEVCKLIVENLAPIARSGVAASVVSFPRGLLPAGGERPVFHDGHMGSIAVDVLPGPWPDGSVRRGLAQWNVGIAAGSSTLRRTLKLVSPADSNQPAPPAFEWTAELVGAIGGLRINMGRGTKWGKLDLIGDYTLAKVYRRRGFSIEAPGLCNELHITALSGQPYMPFSFAWVWSDPSTTDLSKEMWAGRTLNISGAKPVVRGAQSKLVGHSFEDGEFRLKLAREGQRIGDGQGQVIHGVLLLPFDGSDAAQTMMAEELAPLLCGSTSWRDHKAFGPYGYAPEVSEQEAKDWADNQLSRMALNDPWQAPWLGLPSWANQTGAQQAFANQVAYELCAHPRGNLMMALNVAQEACRPIYFREPDGTPVTLERHPLALRWAGRPQIRVNWIDALGKLSDPGDYSTQYRPRDHGALTAGGYEWASADTEHKRERSYLVVHALLTNDPASVALCEEGAEILMSEYPVESGWGDGQAAPRTSRGLYELCWLWLVCNPKLAARVKDHLLRRVRKVILPAFTREGSFVSSQWFDPSNQSGGLPVPHWRPWECAETARLLGAVHELWGPDLADVRAALVALCDSIVEHGIVKRGDGSFQIGTAMANRALTPEEYDNPTLFKPADGTDYLCWSLAAVQQATTPKAREVEAFILANWGKNAEPWRIR
jgi:hypothetical protein